MAAVNADVPHADYSFSQVGDDVLFQNQSIDGNVFVWDFGDGNFSNEVSPTHLYQNSGIYSVQLKAMNACGSDSTSKQVDVIVTRIPEHGALNAVVLYPNPSQGSTFVHLPQSISGTLHYSICELTGRMMDQGMWNDQGGKVMQLPTSHWSPGIYLLELRQKDARRSMKLIIGR